mmetsp:Transcript_7604/g.19307  ORF Transcript_7604/g.19307 Transcript_7604/m.19307 type:complete len:231 (+) Transcript_7604:1263-1955(+)
MVPVSPEYSMAHMVAAKARPVCCCEMPGPARADTTSLPLQMYAISRVYEFSMYTAVAAVPPVFPSVARVISASVVAWYSPVSWQPTRTFTSAMTIASSVSSAQHPSSAPVTGTKPAGAATLGSARMPAPTDEPVISATAPRTLPAATVVLSHGASASAAVVCSTSGSGWAPGASRCDAAARRWLRVPRRAYRWAAAGEAAACALERRGSGARRRCRDKHTGMRTAARRAA